MRSVSVSYEEETCSKVSCTTGNWRICFHLWNHVVFFCEKYKLLKQWLISLRMLIVINNRETPMYLTARCNIWSLIEEYSEISPIRWPFFGLRWKKKNTQERKTGDEIWSQNLKQCKPLKYASIWSKEPTELA